MRAGLGLVKLPVAVIIQGKTMRNTGRGYLVVSIQHDLPTEARAVAESRERSSRGNTRPIPETTTKGICRAPTRPVGHGLLA